ncbi:hypothetical protein Tco_1234458 [Tanacetum coccineum]
MPGCSWRGHLRGAHIHYCSVFLEGTPARGTYSLLLGVLGGTPARVTYSLLTGVLGGDTCEGHIFITARYSWRGHLRWGSRGLRPLRGQGAEPLAGVYLVLQGLELRLLSAPGPARPAVIVVCTFALLGWSVAARRVNRAEGFWIGALSQAAWCCARPA